MTAQRSLDGPLIDLIRDGVPDLADAHGRDYDVPVWNALVRTAMSATQRGHGFDQWIVYVTESRSHLGQQARRMGGRKDRSDREWREHLGKCWNRAQEVIAARPTITPEHIAERIAAVRATVADGETRLEDDERAVLAAVAELAEHHGTTRPACPRREVQGLAGISDPRTRVALSSLISRGVLTIARRGRAGDLGKRRATLLRLPGGDVLSRLTLAETHTPPEDKTYGSSHKTYGFSATPARSEQETTDVDLAELSHAHLLIEEIKRQVRADLLAELRGQEEQHEPTALPTNVRPIRRASA